MQTGWRIGSLFGIPLVIDYSWFIILALATREYASSYRVWGPGLSWSAGLAIALLLFASVLLHELGHSLAAISQGIKVNSITLFLFGGIAYQSTRNQKLPVKLFK
jgi:Zn-dependent protease